jgi:hypothetical protein
MAQENDWGAPRIHGVLKLGFGVSQATVSRYMPPRCRSRSPFSPTWRTFLRLHLGAAVGVDFFDIPTATFDVLRGFLVIDHERRKLLHLGVAKHPTVEWTANQLSEALEDDPVPSRLFRDRDSIFGARFVGKVNALGIEEVISAPQSPWENPFSERVIGSIRRDLLDHVIVLNPQRSPEMVHVCLARLGQ